MKKKLEEPSGIYYLGEGESIVGTTVLLDWGMLIFDRPKRKLKLNAKVKDSDIDTDYPTSYIIFKTTKAVDAHIERLKNIKSKMIKFKAEMKKLNKKKGKKNEKRSK